MDSGATVSGTTISVLLVLPAPPRPGRLQAGFQTRTTSNAAGPLRHFSMDLAVTENSVAAPSANSNQAIFRLSAL